jgi:flavin-binding protein dodecin
MSRTFEVVERVGVSTESLEHAVREVVLEAHSEKKVGWFEIIEQRGRVTSDDKVEFQVKVRIGRKLKD